MNNISNISNNNNNSKGNNISRHNKFIHVNLLSDILEKYGNPIEFKIGQDLTRGFYKKQFLKIPLSKIDENLFDLINNKKSNNTISLFIQEPNFGSTDY